MSGLVLGFSGCRKLSSHSASIATFVIASAVTQPSWSSFAVGCCPSGLDALVSSSFASSPSRLSVFHASSRSAQHLVARSVRFARAVGALVAFPERSCPAGLVPSKFPSRCFCGMGSGTWATAALAAGLGRPVYVAGLHPSSLPSSWGRWVRSCRLPGCWRLVPPALSSPLQLSILSLV